MPLKSPGTTVVWCLVLVPLEPVRSAEPPIKHGSAGVSFSSTFCEATRVAILGGAAANSALISATAERSARERRRIEGIAEQCALLGG